MAKISLNSVSTNILLVITHCTSCSNVPLLGKAGRGYLLLYRLHILVYVHLLLRSQVSLSFLALPLINWVSPWLSMHGIPCCLTVYLCKTVSKWKFLVLVLLSWEVSDSDQELDLYYDKLKMNIMLFFLTLSVSQKRITNSIKMSWHQ